MTVDDAIRRLQEVTKWARKDSVIEAVQLISHSLHKFDAKLATYMLENGVIEMLVAIHR